jgi:hypothetical protein
MNDWEQAIMFAAIGALFLWRGISMKGVPSLIDCTDPATVFRWWLKYGLIVCGAGSELLSVRLASTG